MGPDFGAAVLHDWATDLAQRTAKSRFAKPYSNLSTGERAAVDGEVGALLKANRYDSKTDTLTLLPAAVDTFHNEIDVWKAYFEHPINNGGLPVRVVSDPQELHDLTAFFTWAAWSSVAQRPGTTHSYTNNFPYDPLAGNHPSGAALAVERDQLHRAAWRHRNCSAGVRKVRLSRLARHALGPGTLDLKHGTVFDTQIHGGGRAACF